MTVCAHLVQAAVVTAHRKKESGAMEKIGNPALIAVLYAPARMGRRTAGGDLVTVETQKRICFAVLAVTTGPAASVWIRADAHFTAAEHLGCTAASSAAAWKGRSTAGL